jgi:hypothetical protein
MKKDLTPDTITCISYCNTKGEKSTRDILPLYAPNENIKGIDVTSLDQQDRDSIVECRKQYKEYVNNHMATMFSFDDWAEHSGIKLPKIDYRTFNINRLKVVVGSN